MWELDYRLSPAIGPDYYRRHPAVYREEAPWVRLLSRYLTERGGMPQEPVSLNERSFQIFGREKFLQREQGRKILTHCGVTLEQLEVYRTTEPLAYYSCSTKTPQNVLILENKDTFYSIRRHLLSGRTMLFGAEISTVIYGAGKGILRSFEDFGFCVEPHINDASNRILYFGDLDYEGIGIYERLRELPPVAVYEPEYVRPDPALQNPRAFTVARADDGAWDVDAPWLERILEGSDVSDYESLQYFQRQLADGGVITRLVELGVQENDTIRIGEFEFDYVF